MNERRPSHAAALPAVDERQVALAGFFVQVHRVPQLGPVFKGAHHSPQLPLPQLNPNIQKGLYGPGFSGLLSRPGHLWQLGPIRPGSRDQPNETHDRQPAKFRVVPPIPSRPSHLRGKTSHIDCLSIQVLEQVLKHGVAFEPFAELHSPCVALTGMHITEPQLGLVANPGLGVCGVGRVEPV